MPHLPRIALLASPESWYTRDLQRAAAGRCELAVADFTLLSAHVAAGACRVFAGEIALSDSDAVLVRTMPAGSLEEVVIRMDVLAALEGAGVRVVNPPKAIEAAVDKFLCSARLAAAGLPTPRTIVCQDAGAAVDAFETLGGDVVLKPLFGGEGRGLVRIDDGDLLVRAARLLSSNGAAIYLQEFIRHAGCDLRVLLLGDQSWAVRRTNRADWRTNAARGATVREHLATPEQLDLARRAATVVGATFAGVDLVEDEAGRTLVLEVNAVPGWKSLAAACRVDVAAALLAWAAAG